ncbi:hypothetical protein [Caballeronia sp. S22]|uniref:hypothetical protein n=1 Tax=Caballeronia sp. S22 TaxID=3137182 RepID=UPI003530CCBD
MSAPTVGGVNPSLTIQAIALRTALWAGTHRGLLACAALGITACVLQGLRRR